MEYIKAETVLPPELLREVQRYVDGRILYIPRAAGARRGWGEKTAAREDPAGAGRGHLPGLPAGPASRPTGREIFPLPQEH